MAQKEETNQKKIAPQQSDRPNLWIVIALVAGSGLILTALFGNHGLMRWLHSDQEKKTLTAKLQKIEGENALIRQEIDALMHNGNYVELIARRDLGMVKGDEIIYQFLPNTTRPETIKPLPEKP